MNTPKAQRLMARMEAALRRGDTQEAYRYGVAALTVENAYRLLRGWQPIAVSARTRAIAAGSAAA